MTSHRLRKVSSSDEHSFLLVTLIKDNRNLMEIGVPFRIGEILQFL